MRRNACLFILLFLTLSPPGLSADIPPAGYSWVSFTDIGANFLLPNRWKASFKQGKLMASMVMQEKEAEVETPTRFTINIVSNLTKTNFRLVSEQLVHYADAHDQTDGLSVQSKSVFVRGSFHGVSLTMIQSTHSSENLKIQRIYLANDQKDWLVIINFQSRETQWTSLDAIRHTMMSGFKMQ